MNARIRKLYKKYNNTSLVVVLIIVILFWTYIKDSFNTELIGIFGYSMSMGLAILIGIGLYLYWPSIKKFF